jgi:PD-(D/E)XK endonuclease
MEHPKEIGDQSQLAVMLALRRAGYALLVPVGENTRYDVVIETTDAFFRVQCKTGRLRRGAVVWPVCSSYAHHSNPKQRQRDYHGDVDFFGVFCRETGAVYLVPIEDLNVTRYGSLRVEPARNSQRKFIREAARYEIGNVGPLATAGLRESSGAPEPCA